jgi:hypothetical protein
MNRKTRENARTSDAKTESQRDVLRLRVFSELEDGQQVVLCRTEPGYGICLPSLCKFLRTRPGLQARSHR